RACRWRSDSAASQEGAQEVRRGVHELGAPEAPLEVDQRDLLALSEIFLEDVGEGLVQLLAAHEAARLEVEAEAAVVDVGAADQRELVVEDRDLGVEHRRPVLEDARAGGEELRVVGASCPV